VKDGLTLIPVAHVLDVLKVALVSAPVPIEWDEAAEAAAAAAKSPAAGATAH